MNVARRIAYRYLIGKKSAQAINIVSWISLGAITIATAAMLLSFCVFNGFEGLIKDMYVAFYPDLHISPEEGKNIQITPAQRQALDKMENVYAWSPVLEDMALLQGYDQQKVITLKGVDDKWFTINNIDSYMVSGQANWTTQQYAHPAIVGLQIAYELGIDVTNPIQDFTIFYPNTDKANFASLDAIKQITAIPTGAFSIQQEFDGQYILTNLATARDLFNTPEDYYSGIDIKLKDVSGRATQKTINALQQVLPNVSVKTRYQQNQTLYMIMNSERWLTYGVLLLILVIASFNMIGSLSMLVLEKRQDISILKSMGAGPDMIFKVFMWVGTYIAGVGVTLGLILGTILAIIQQQFGIISMGEGFVISAYPVQFSILDYGLILITTFGIALIATYFPAKKAAKQAMIFVES